MKTTPIEKHGDLWLKREDLYTFAGISGGKVRSCLALAEGAVGLITASARKSPQMQIVARIAHAKGIPARCHIPAGPETPEMVDAEAHGAELVKHRPGHNTVICARAYQDATKDRTSWTYIPFGMQCATAVTMTRKQVQSIPKGVKRIVVPVGSGISAAGILWGLMDQGLRIPVVGVCVGADPRKRLDVFAPPMWRHKLELVRAPDKYHDAVEAEIDGIRLDPIYEAKCERYLQPGDLFWVIGIRPQNTQEVEA